MSAKAMTAQQEKHIVDLLNIVQLYSHLGKQIELGQWSGAVVISEALSQNIRQQVVVQFENEETEISMPA